ncbi:phosphonate C-P lyase system protein PhnG [Pandoraea faecigallinarum]|uniref:Phosphonate C-P lyase system protein PhnG n=1 Tax=Pandoraea faecigallinarum TaxID=656179 RepID=A0A0H3WTE7_9BURK|nr:phosphonate C-P lyase system protein PhnG [Pandoraea faecigallinarum]AKM31027.1 phosphonate C-P lyase system protein PhnG [Pandoraea faecigallinarum]
MRITSSDTTRDEDGAARQTRPERARWLALLARATRDELDDAIAHCPDAPPFVWLRAPQTGLVMVQGRVGGSGERFNLGETTVTRCTLRQQDGVIGTGYVLGRDSERAVRVARLDALMQMPLYRSALAAGALATISQRLTAAAEQRDADTAASRVEFFTMVREA